MLHKIIFKNPIFILKGNQLFYTKSEKWYDLSKCKVYESIGGRCSMTTLNVVGNTGYDNSIDEQYFYIKDDGLLRKKLKPYLNK